jgi:serine/threonine-protein kinase HipA
MNELLALLDGEEIGVVRQKGGRLSFAYHEAWLEAKHGYPLSLSLPLASGEHRHAAVSAYLWGLLPDNERVLERWSKQFHVSARNPFALLGAVGEDCAGAAQFVPREGLERATRGQTSNVAWLSQREVADRIRVLTHDATAWRRADDAGQFSLAGAQPKTALLFDGKRWGVPSGRTPTTHILKPTLTDLPGHAENEYLCLALARRLGLATASATIQRFDEVTAIVVERYDRTRAGREIRRIHQEDMCQALGRRPQTKYESEGGPTAYDVVELLRAAASSGDDGNPVAEADVWSFIEALMFNFLIGGTDAHAKNYSLLIGPGVVRLAPLYDVASIFAYPDINPKKAKLAMKLGGKYRLEEIGLTEWRAFARKARVSEEALLERLFAMQRALPDCLGSELRGLEREGVKHPVFARIRSELIRRAARPLR